MLAHQRSRLIKTAKEEIEASSPEGLINQLDKVAQQPGRVHQPARQVSTRAQKQGLTIQCSKSEEWYRSVNHHLNMQHSQAA